MSKAKMEKEQEFFYRAHNTGGALILHPASFPPEDIVSALLYSPVIQEKGSVIVTEKGDNYTAAFGNPGFYSSYDGEFLSSGDNAFAIVDDLVAFARVAPTIEKGHVKPIFLVPSLVTPEEVEAIKPWSKLVGYISPTYFGPRISMVLHKGSKDYHKKIRLSSEIEGVHAYPDDDPKEDVSHLHFLHGTTPEEYVDTLRKFYRRRLYTFAVPVLSIHYYCDETHEEEEKWERFSSWLDGTTSAFRSLCSVAEILQQEEGFFRK